MYQLEIKDLALKTIQEAYDWYEEQRIELGESFLGELSAVFEKLSQQPEYYSFVSQSYRQVKVPGYPYVVVYEIMEQSVVVYAVFHTSKNPNDKLPE